MSLPTATEANSLHAATPSRGAPIKDGPAATDDRLSILAAAAAISAKLCFIMTDDGVQSNRDQSNEEQLHRDQSSNVHSSTSQGSTTNQSGAPKQVEFNEYGQPVGIGSEQFSTTVGKITRAHCAPAISSWKKVPSCVKEAIWNNILHQYDVPEIQKRKVLHIANIAWKSWKNLLRKEYDKFGSDAERKRKRPETMKKEYWEDFVDFCSTEEDKKRREKGKKARQQIKRLHSSGRTGCARIADKMKKESATGEINRTELYVITHTRKSGSTSRSTSDGLDEIRRLVTVDPYLGERDLDNDPVALVCGLDGKGSVRGMGSGVTRTEIRASAPSREIARKEKQQGEMLKNEIATLREEVSRLKEIVQNNAPRLSHQPESHSSYQEVGPNLASRNCFLKNLRRKHIAFGRVNMEAPPNEHTYSIIVDEIIDGSELLYDRDEKFDDIMIGEIINWPKANVQFIRI